MGTQLDGRNLAQALMIVTGPLLDNARTGPFRALVARAIGTGDTVVAHALGRVPNGYIMYRSPGGIIYDATDGVASWTSSSIKLRATVFGNYSLLVF